MVLTEGKARIYRLENGMIVIKVPSAYGEAIPKWEEEPNEIEFKQMNGQVVFFKPNSA